MKFDLQKRGKMLAGVVWVARLVLGCVFIYASLPKIQQPYGFLSTVYNFEMVGPKFGLLITMALPWLELFTGICLLGGIFVSGALLLSVLISITFSIVIYSAIMKGLDISCGCFGNAAGQINYSTLIRALSMVCVAGFGYLCAVIIPGRRFGSQCLSSSDVDSQSMQN